MLSKLEAYQSDIEKNSTSFKEIGNLNPKSIQEVNAEKWAKDKQTFIDHGLIDESTGIGKALKAFNTAKTKYTTAKTKKTNDEGKLRLSVRRVGWSINHSSDQCTTKGRI